MIINNYLEQDPERNYQGRTSRRGFLTAGLTGLGAIVAASLPVYAYSTEQGKKDEQKPQEQEEKVPSYEDFKKVLGDRLIPKLENRVKKRWNKISDKSKIRLYEIYSDPEKYIQEKLDEKSRKELEGYGFKEGIKIFSRVSYPWKFDFEKDLSSRIIGYESEQLRRKIPDLIPQPFFVPTAPY